MNAVILTLFGGLKAWGRPTNDSSRPIQNHPSVNAIKGVVGACMGSERGSGLLDDVTVATVSVATEYRTINNDYQIIQESIMPNGKTSPESIISLREFESTVVIDDNHLSFLPDVGILFTEDDSMAKRIASAVLNPSFTPYLGRRAFPLTRPMIKNIDDSLLFNVSIGDVIANVKLILGDDSDKYILRSQYSLGLRGLNYNSTDGINHIKTRMVRGVL